VDIGGDGRLRVSSLALLVQSLAWMSIHVQFDSGDLVAQCRVRRARECCKDERQASKQGTIEIIIA